MPLQMALSQHDTWLQERGVAARDFAVVTWSDWDLKVMLESECKWRHIQKPLYFNRCKNRPDDLSRLKNRYAPDTLTGCRNKNRDNKRGVWFFGRRGLEWFAWCTINVDLCCVESDAVTHVCELGHGGGRIHTHTQTYKHTNIQTYKHTNIQTYKHTYTYTYTYTYTDTQTYRHTHSQTYKQTNISWF